MQVRLHQHVRDLPEHSDDVLAAPKRHRADLDRDMSALGVYDRHGCVRDLCDAHDLARKISRARCVSSGATTEVNWRPT